MTTFPNSVLLFAMSVAWEAEIVVVFPAIAWLLAVPITIETLLLFVAMSLSIVSKSTFCVQLMKSVFNSIASILFVFVVIPLSIVSKFTA